MAIEILHRDDLPLGGFAGLKEHRLVMSPKIFGPHANPDTWSGIGRFVYCADARFNPHGETRMHDHKEIDVISVMIEGRIDHEGSLEHGQALAANDVQVQRAGGEGFSHNEINPDDSINRMIQLWVLPEQAGKPAAYKLYRLPPGKLTRVYGGSNDQSDTFPSHTVIEVALFDSSEELVIDKPFLAYLAVGEATANSIEMAEGTLFKGDRLTFQGQSNGKLIVIYEI